MPLYTFECTTCGARFEQRRHMADSSMPSCPAGHRTVRRVFDTPSVIFKGTGFYITDHRRPSKQEE